MTLRDDAFSFAETPPDVVTSLVERPASGIVTIDDAHLLFSGQFDRSGQDLIVSDADHRVVVHDYFRGDKRPMLASRDGAVLDAKVIEALAGHVVLAQVGVGSPTAKVVGQVVKITGSASIVRNGVAITVNNGDNVYQGDLVQTGSGSTLGLVLIDGTSFNLSANARLLLNDLVYDANSTSNSSLMTLVQGAASFVAGQIAKTGDMKVATPVATMGIRGTAVTLDINATDGRVKISVIDQRDNQLHTVQVYDRNGTLIGTVTSNGPALTLTPTATFEVLAQQTNKTPLLVAQEFAVFQQVLTTYDAGKQLAPSTPPPTDGRRGDATPVNPNKFAGSTPAEPVQNTATVITSNDAGQSRVVTQTVEAIATEPARVTVVAAPKVTEPSTSQAVTILLAPAVPPLPAAAPVAAPIIVASAPITQISSGNGNHVAPVISADGRFVTYDPDGTIYLYDRQTSSTVTVAAPANGLTYGVPTISSDGRTVVYQGTSGSQSWVFVYNNDPSDPNYKQTTQLTAGASPAISGNGNMIVVDNGGGTVTIFDRAAHVVATITPSAVGSSGSIWKPAINADGHVVAFWESSTQGSGGAGQLFVYDLATGSLTKIAETAAGAGNVAASFSADGHYVVYQSTAPGGHSEIHLYDLTSGAVVFQTANAVGASYNPAISPDGHFIVFASANQLTGADTNNASDTYVVDVTDPAHPTYRLVSTTADGTVGNGASDLGAAISAGGDFVTFASSSPNLSGNGSGQGQIFIVDPSFGRSAFITESNASPAMLTASGTIAISNGVPGQQVSVVQSAHGVTTASIGSDGNLHWTYSAARSDFAFLTPGQVSSQNIVFTIATGTDTTAIPLKVSIYDADLPAVTIANAAPKATDVVLASQVEDSRVTISAATLLAGVTDINPDTLAITDLTITSGGGSLLRQADGNYSYTPTANYNGPVTFAYTASDGRLTSIASASLAITPINDAPVVTSATLAVTEGGATVLTPSDIGVLDPDSAAFSYTVANVTHGMFQTSGNGVDWIAATGFTSAQLAAEQVRFVHDGGEAAPTFSVQTNDGTATNNLSNTLAANVAFTNVNDAPVVSGPNAITVHEDDSIANRTVVRQLTANDGDDNTQPVWTVHGGTTPAPTQYSFALNNFKVVRTGSGGFTFDDDFNSGNAPSDVAANAPNYANTNMAASYATTGSFVETHSNNGFVTLDATHAVETNGVNTSARIVGNFATLLTNTTAAATAGLRQASAFSVSGDFDLTQPAELRQEYGIRLTDRLGSSLGNDTLDLVIRKSSNGVVVVQLRHLDQAGDVSETIESAALNPMAGEDHVQLRLSHAANSSAINAAFDLYAGTTLSRTVNFNSTGTIFNGETFTRAGFFAATPSPTVSYLSGTYGTLSVDSTGATTYSLNNGSAAVQSLAAGQTMHDVFTVDATDPHGAIGQRTVTVDVIGTNDAPTMVAASPVLTVGRADQIEPSGQTVRSFISPNAVDTIHDVDVNAQQGIAITGMTAIDGTWQFSTNGGAAWTAFANYTASSALLLDANDLVRFVPASGAVGNTSNSFTYRAWDETTGSHGATVSIASSGASTAYSTTSNTASLRVDPAQVNMPPVIATSAIVIDTDFSSAPTSQAVVIFGGVEPGKTSMPGGHIINGELQLTADVSNSAGAIAIHPATAPKAFHATFDAFIGGGGGRPADGFSFNYGSGIPMGGYVPWEEVRNSFAADPNALVVPNGLMVGVETFLFSDQTHGRIFYAVNGVEVASVLVPIDDLVTNSFVPVYVSVANNALTVIYNGRTYFDHAALSGTVNGTPYAFDPSPDATFVIGGRTGGAHEELRIDNLRIGAGGGIETMADQSVAIPGLSISDPDAGSTHVQTTLSVAYGTLALAQTTGLFGDLDGSDGTLTFIGSINAINQALQGLTYQSPQTGADRLMITVDDLGHTGSGSAQITTAIVDIAIGSVPPPVYAPSIQATAPSSVIEATSSDPGAPTAISYLTLTDGSGIPFYDVNAMTASGWLDDGQGLLIYAGTYGTATLDRSAGTLTYRLDNRSVNSQTSSDQVNDSFILQVADDGNATSSTNVTFIIEGRDDDVAPSVDTHVTNSPLLTVGRGSVIVAPDLTISTNAAMLIGATVYAVNGGDVSINAPGGSISTTYNLDSGVLTLSGEGTPQQYQDALRTVEYSINENGLPSGSDTSRQIYFEIMDSGYNTSSGAMSYAAVAINHSPIHRSKNVVFTLDAATPFAMGDAGIRDVDSNETLSVRVHDFYANSFYLDGSPITEDQILTPSEFARLQFDPTYLNSQGPNALGTRNGLTYNVTDGRGGDDEGNIAFVRQDTVRSPYMATLGFEDLNGVEVPWNYGAETGHAGGFTGLSSNLTVNALGQGAGHASAHFASGYYNASLGHGQAFLMTGSLYSYASELQAVRIEDVYVAPLNGARTLTIVAYDHHAQTGATGSFGFQTPALSTLTYDLSNIPDGTFVSLDSLIPHGLSNLGALTRLEFATDRGNFAIDDLAVTALPTLTGTYGNDALVGSTADELFYGLAGDDLLTGGAGHDNFVFTNSSGHDTITDFTPGTDTIEIRPLPFPLNETAFQSWLSQHGEATTNGAVLHLDVVGSANFGSAADADTLHLTNVSLSNLHVTDFVAHGGLLHV